VEFTPWLGYQFGGSFEDVEIDANSPLPPVRAPPLVYRGNGKKTSKSGDMTMKKTLLIAILLVAAGWLSS